MSRFDRIVAGALAASLLVVPCAPLRADEPTPAASPLSAELGALAARLAQERWDVPAQAAALGSGVDAAFAFVRDQVRVEAYRGLLRGARGALLSRAGNALDRSSLLAALLREKGVAARFAVGRLDETKAKTLFDRMFEPRPESAERGTGVPPPALQLRAWARATRDHVAVMSALGRSAWEFRAPTREKALADLAEHAWVQAQVDGTWVDLDPSFPDAVPGKAYAEPTATFEEIPTSLRQTVTLRVVAETLKGGELARQTRLEYSGAVEDLLDANVHLFHLPANAPGLEGAISAAASEGEAWVPVLWVEGEAFHGQPVAFAEGGKAERGGPPSGGLGGLSRALGGSQALVAEWLEIDVAIPGSPTETVRRALLDRARPTWRAAATNDVAGLLPLERIEKDLCAPRRVHNLLFSAGRHDLSAYANALRAQLESAPPPADAKDVPFEDRIRPFALQNASLPIATDHAVVPSLYVVNARFYADSPRVVVVTAGAGVREGKPFRHLLVDLLRDRVCGVARNAADESTVAKQKIWYGLLQGALEHELCARQAEGIPGAITESTSATLSDDGALALAREHGPADLASADARVRAMEAVNAGLTLVAPKAALGSASTAWWEIAPDGTTRAVYEEWSGGLSRFPWENRGPPLRQPPPGGSPAPVPVDPPPRPSGPVHRPPTFPAPSPTNPAPPRIPPPPWTQPGANVLKPPPPGTRPVPGAMPTGPIDPTRPPPGADKKKGGGNEYLMVLGFLSLNLAWTVLIDHAPQLMSWVADHLGRAVAAEIEAARE